MVIGKYIPKEEWKKELRDLAKSQQQVIQEEKKEETVSEKANRRSKLKSKQRPAASTDKILK